MTEPTDYERQKYAATVKSESERLREDIGMFLRMGFTLGELGIVMRENEPDEVVPTIMMENAE